MHSVNSRLHTVPLLSPQCWTHGRAQRRAATEGSHKAPLCLLDRSLIPSGSRLAATGLGLTATPCTIQKRELCYLNQLLWSHPVAGEGVSQMTRCREAHWH